MMFCNNCGKELPENAKFCTACGQIAEETDCEKAPSTAAEAEAIITGKNKKRPIAVLTAAAVVVALIAAVVVAAATGAFAGSEAKLGKAVLNSVKAYAAAAEQLPELPEMDKDGDLSQTITLVANEIPELGTDYSGYGLRLDTATRMAERKMRIDLSLLAGKPEPLAELTLFAKDELLALGSPRMIGETWLGVNTETLGTDLTALLGEELGELSFNLFEMTKTEQPSFSELPYDEEAGKTLLSAVTIEKADKRELNVNGTALKCAGYTVTVPAEAVTAYLYAQIKAYRTTTLVDEVLAVYESMGLDTELLDIDTDVVDTLADELEAAVDFLERELEDIVLSVYTSKDYVMAVLGEVRIENEAVQFEAYFGGGERYVDDFSFELIAPEDEMRICLTSKGDHGLNSGVFTDKTELLIENYGVADWHLVSDLSYDPVSGGLHLQLEEKAFDAFSFRAEGSLKLEKDRFDLQLSRLALTAEGETLSLQLGYAAAPCTALELPETEPAMVLQMDENELYALGLELGINLGTYLQELMDDYPWVEELIMSLT